jgi:hypothetical protein
MAGLTRPAGRILDTTGPARSFVITQSYPVTYYLNTNASKQSFLGSTVGCLLQTPSHELNSSVRQSGGGGGGASCSGGAEGLFQSGEGGESWGVGALY